LFQQRKIKSKTFSCYRAEVKKLGENEYEVYLFQSTELGGDTRILINGQVEIWREVSEKDKKGRVRFKGWKRIDLEEE